MLSFKNRKTHSRDHLEVSSLSLLVALVSGLVSVPFPLFVNVLTQGTKANEKQAAGEGKETTGLESVNVRSGKKSCGGGIGYPECSVNWFRGNALKVDILNRFYKKIPEAVHFIKKGVYFGSQFFEFTVKDWVSLVVLNLWQCSCWQLPRVLQTATWQETCRWLSLSKWFIIKPTTI